MFLNNGNQERKGDEVPTKGSEKGFQRDVMDVCTHELVGYRDSAINWCVRP